MITQLRALGDLLARARLAAVAGKTFGGKRDLYEALGYDRIITEQMYRERYRRNAVAARIVEAFPVDTWRGGAEVWDDQDPDTETEFEKAFAALDKRLKIMAALRRADILAGLGRYAIVVIGAPGSLESPLTRATAEEIAYLSRYAEEDAPIERLVEDESDPRFGMPLHYTVGRTATSSGTKIVSVAARRKVLVHYSRVLHVADGLLDDDIFGTPRLERVWNLLDDLEKVTGGGAEAFWRRSDGGTHVNVDPVLELTDPQIEELKAESEDFVHGLKRFLATRGVEINRLGSDVANFEGPVKAIFEQLSAGTGIPQRVLMGSEQGKLAADQDSVKYYRTVEARRRDFAETYILRPFVDRLIELGALPEPKKGVYEAKWSQVRTMDDEEKADLAKKLASINQVMGGETVITVDEIRGKLDLAPLDQVVDDVLKKVPEEQRELSRALLKGDVKAVAALIEGLVLPAATDPSLKTLTAAHPVTLNLTLGGRKGHGRHKIIHDRDGIAVAIEAEE